MTTHELKSWPQPYQDILDGVKKFEWRRNDRGFQKGDHLVLREWNPEVWSPVLERHSGEYTGRSCEVRAVYIQPGGEYGIPSEFCILGVQFIRTLK